MIRFRADTTLKTIGFCVVDMKNPNILQRVTYHAINMDNRGKWIEISDVFVCRKENMNSFSIGAAQLTGENRYIEFEYVRILEE